MCINGDIFSHFQSSVRNYSMSNVVRKVRERFAPIYRIFGRYIISNLIQIFNFIGYCKGISMATPF